MKNKFNKVLGIAFALVIIASLVIFAIPASAGLYVDALSATSNVWTSYAPTAGAAGGWFFDPDITGVGPAATAINGDIYAYVERYDGSFHYDIFKSTDDGRSWSVSTIPGYYGGGHVGGPVVDMVCSSLSEDILYVTDGNYVYKSVNGAMTFSIVAEDSLETMLVGCCGPLIVLDDELITCLDVTYNADDDPYVFIGVTATYLAPDACDTSNGDPDVLYINEAGYPAEWLTLGLYCFHANGSTHGDYVPWAVGCDPNFADTKKIYVAVTNDNDFTIDEDNDTNFLDAENDPHTWIISSVGINCSWNEVDELLWNCTDDDDHDFQIWHASRFAFPDDFGDFATMFLGVASMTDFWNGTTFVGSDPGNDDIYEGGDVYMITDSAPFAQDAVDLNVRGQHSSCDGIAHADIWSLDILGSTDYAALVAGAVGDNDDQVPTEVYYSTDGGWTWDDSDKDPTGVDYVEVLWNDDASAVFAGTFYCDCAFSMSCSEEAGKYFNQISLVNTDITNVIDMSHSPGYAVDSNTMYVLTMDGDACLRSGNQVANSVWRHDGTYWERVWSSRAAEFATIDSRLDWVEVSPDFNSTDTLYVANDAFQMFRSQDAGCSWRAISHIPCEGVTISAWIVVDEETVLTAGCGSFAGTIYKTERHGSRPWEEVTLFNCLGAKSGGNGVDFDLSPQIATDSSVIFGNDDGEVYLSSDIGSTWDEIADAVTGDFGSDYDTYVVFDPGYGTAGDPGETTIYAAGDDDIGRCSIDADASFCKQDWLFLSNGPQATCDPFDLYWATGIAAAGDTTLYVSDGGYDYGYGAELYIYEGTIELMCDNGCCSYDLDVSDEDIYVTSGTFIDGELLEILQWNLTCDCTWTVEMGPCYTVIAGEVDVRGYTSGATGWINISTGSFECTCGVSNCLDGNATIISGHMIVQSSGSVAPKPSGVWRTVNPLDVIDEASGYNAVEFEFLTNGLDSPNTSTLCHPPVALGTGFVFPDDLWLTAGSNVLWALDPGNPTRIWVWDDPLATQVTLLSPADGALVAGTGAATLEWEALDAATDYEVYVYAACPECISPNEMKLFAYYATTSGDTCITVTGLTPGSTYYWKVRVACDSPYVSKWSDMWSFNTSLTSVVLCAPACSAEDINISPTFSWDAVPGATSYDIEIATDDAFTAIVASGSTSTNAFALDSDLSYLTKYYWRVRANGANGTSAWSTCIFTTAAEPVVPVEETYELVQTTEEITPAWIWVIIGIGGALVIAVIILIVTTRRVP